MKRQRWDYRMTIGWGCLYKERKNQTPGHRKIPLTLLLMLLLSFGPVAKTIKMWSSIFKERSILWEIITQLVRWRFVKFKSWFVTRLETNWLTLSKKPFVSDYLLHLQWECSRLAFRCQSHSWASESLVMGGGNCITFVLYGRAQFPAERWHSSCCAQMYLVSNDAGVQTIILPLQACFLVAYSGCHWFSSKMQSGQLGLKNTLTVSLQRVKIPSSCWISTHIFYTYI